jgi:hypothetical protein
VVRGRPASIRRLLLPAAIATVAAWSPGTASAATPHRCRDVVIRTGSGAIHTRTTGLFGIGVGCTTARKVARYYLSRNEGNAGGPVRPYGYRCSGGEDGVSCRKGRRIVTWGFYAD